MHLVVAWRNATTFNIAVAMGTVRYNYSHTWGLPYVGDMPQAITAVGIWFPNSRDYDYEELAAAAPSHDELPAPSATTGPLG